MVKMLALCRAAQMTGRSFSFSYLYFITDFWIIQFLILTTNGIVVHEKLVVAEIGKK